jgi:2,4-dienoyl-CoA reductase-like NADH-dependent reductase (Old Yellow Enzyme family)
LKEPDPGKKSFLYWAEKNLKEGICDMVGIGRQSLADPLFAKKMTEGKSAEVNYCIACGSCSQLLRTQAQTGCPIYFEYYKKLLKETQKTKG